MTEFARWCLGCLSHSILRGIAGRRFLQALKESDYFSVLSTSHDGQRNTNLSESSITEEFKKEVGKFSARWLPFNHPAQLLLKRGSKPLFGAYCRIFVKIQRDIALQKWIIDCWNYLRWKLYYFDIVDKIIHPINGFKGNQWLWAESR